MSQPFPVDIISDDDDGGASVAGGVSYPSPNIQNDTVVVVDISTPLPTHPSKKQRIDFNSNPTTVFIIDDDPTPLKPSTGATTSTSFVAETPLSDASTFKCSKGSYSLDSIPAMVEDTPISELSKSKVAVLNSSKESPGEGTSSFLADTPMSDLSKHKVPVVTSDKNNSDAQQLLRSVLDVKFSDDQTPSSVVDTPMSDVSKHEVPIVNYNRDITDSQPLSLSVSDPKFSGIRGVICLESDNESENGSGIEATKQIDTSFTFDAANEMEWNSTLSESAFPSGSLTGNVNMLLTAKGSSLSSSTDCDTSLAHGHLHSETERVEQTSRIAGEKTKSKDKDNTTKKKSKNTDEAIGRKRMSKEDKIRLQEEKKQQKEQEKLRKASEKAEAADMKKLQQEKLKWEKGKFALKSIVAEVDTRVVERLVGGHLLTRFADKGVSYRITSNPIERSIVWTMTVPDHIAQISSEETEVRYVLLVYEAEEFCNIIMNDSLMDHVSQVQRRYPNHTICYLTNRLLAYIYKKEQEHYKNPSNCIGWRRPPIEEALSKLTTHFTRVHTRQCIDEAELAEHVVGLTCSLASCQFRKKLTRLSVNANGSNVSKDSVDRNLIKKNVWLKALVAIPKVQPRFAIAIWKKFPTMKSLLSVYMDPSKSVHEKEFLLKDLITEGLLGDDRRLGEVCSKRVYRILMAQSGDIITEDVENGADFFSH